MLTFLFSRDIPRLFHFICKCICHAYLYIWPDLSTDYTLRVTEKTCETLWVLTSMQLYYEINLNRIQLRFYK